MHTSRRDVLKRIGGSAALAVLSGLGAPSARSAETAAPDTKRLANPLLDPEVISAGHTWTEGPVWWPDGKQLLFSDVPGNAISSWDGRTTTVFLSPSGYAGTPMPEVIREGGSNGLALGRGGLLLADSGNRCVSVLDFQSRRRTVLASHYQGKRLNSPNDLVVARNGDIYFTDPPYGLVGVNDSPHRELNFTGVFRITTDNQLQLVAENLFPNGIGLSPDNRILYVTDRSGWVAIDLDANGAPVGQRLFMPAETVGGRGDGLKVDHAGRLWCSGPGGIHVFSREGRHIGHSPLAGRVSNCAFGPGGVLFVTNSERVLRARIAPDFA